MNNIVYVKWQDTKPITLILTYAGITPLDEARRWEKSLEKHVNIGCRMIIQEYNTFIGGVDVLNAHIAHSKFTIRSRRWYIILFWHFITLALTNAWQVYRPKRDWGITSQNIQDM